MKQLNLRTLVFLALCCDLGLFAKRIISPAANLITDALHIPGGIGTSFSLMFVVIAASLVPCSWCGASMGVVQSVLALGLGMVGSMGALSLIGYIVPGIVIDLVQRGTRNIPLARGDRIVLMNAMAAPSAALTANLIVFQLRGAALLLYLCVSATSGVLFGILGANVVQRLTPVIGTALVEPNTKKRQGVQV